MSTSPEPMAGSYVVGKLLALNARFRGVIPRVTASNSDDVDAVHDLRVILRRTRTVLEMGRAVLGRFHADQVRRALRDVQRATGALRDEEVLLDLVSSLPIDPATIYGWLRIRRGRERAMRRALVRQIQAGELERGRALLDALLAFPVDPSLDRPLAKYAYRAVARARRRVGRRQDARTDDPVALHELRIAFKRLRYVAEVFAEVLPSDLAALAQPAARLQSCLGAVHDVDVVLGCVRRARSLSPAARLELLTALTRLREERTARYDAEAGQLSRGTPVHVSGVEALRKTSTR